jgi:hypothetical protein
MEETPTLLPSLKSGSWILCTEALLSSDVIFPPDVALRFHNLVFGHEDIGLGAWKRQRKNWGFVFAPMEEFQ